MGKKAKKGGGKKGGKGKKGAKKEKKSVNRDEELQNAITNALLCKQNLSLCTRQVTLKLLISFLISPIFSAMITEKHVKSSPQKMRKFPARCIRQKGTQLILFRC